MIFIQNLRQLLCFLCLKILPPPPHSVIVHILHNNSLTLENRDKFSYIAGRYGQIVKFHNVEILCADRIAEYRKFVPLIDAPHNPWTIVAMYRFLIIDLLTEDTEKAIYLDSDTIINLDIRDLWQIDLGDAPLAGVAGKANGNKCNDIQLCVDGVVSKDDYFNSGVLLLNLKILKNEYDFILEGMDFVGKNRYGLFDQDILNYCFSKRFLKLPRRFNYRSADPTAGNFIYHYGGPNGLDFDLKRIISRLFMEYFVKTPCFNERTLEHLYESIRQTYIEQKIFVRQISEVMSGKSRAFFIIPINVEVVKRIFHVKPNEEIISADSPESLQHMINSFKNSGGNKVFFVFVNNFTAIQYALNQVGLTYGKDFFNGLDFLSDAEGVPLNAHSFIRLL